MLLGFQTCQDLMIPSYWNYKNDKLDELTQKIYTGDFESSKERTGADTRGSC